MDELMNYVGTVSRNWEKNKWHLVKEMVPRIWS